MNMVTSMRFCICFWGVFLKNDLIEGRFDAGIDIGVLYEGAHDLLYAPGF